MIQLLSNTTTPHFQLLPLSKVDRSLLRIQEVPPLQQRKISIICDCVVLGWQNHSIQYSGKLVHLFQFQVYLFCGNIILSFCGAFILSMAFEAPMMGLEKVLLGKGKKT